jgi:hypothetical protein
LFLSLSSSASFFLSKSFPTNVISRLETDLFPGFLKEKTEKNVDESGYDHFYVLRETSVAYAAYVTLNIRQNLENI